MAMAILVKLHGRFRAAAGISQLEVPATIGSIRDLLDLLSTRFGPEIRRYMFALGGDLSPNLMVLVNEHSVKMLKGLGTPLSESDTVMIDSVDITELVGGG